MDWDEFFFEMAVFVSKKSKDRSTKVGCVITGPSHEVRTIGFNGFCRGIDDDVDSRHERPAKYYWTEHAERNAIYNAARNGIRTEECTAYISSFPCADCSRALIQSGIKKIVTTDNSNKTKIPEENYKIALAMLEECNIELKLVKEKAA